MTGDNRVHLSIVLEQNNTLTNHLAVNQGSQRSATTLQGETVRDMRFEFTRLVP
jgi:hypothetical protein